MSTNSAATPHNPLEGSRPELSINLHTGTDEQVSIIIVHKDRPEYLNICLQTIAVASFSNNYEVIVVDNNSGKDGQDFLDEIEGDVKVIRNDKNLYWSEAANKGAEAADKNSKYFIFMHYDVAILNPSWIDLLINVCDSQKSGMVGVEMKSYYLQQKKVDFISEWLLMVTRECWQECGPFHEKLPLIGHSFVLTLKAQNKDFKPQIMKNPIAHHYKHFSIDINDWERLTESAMIMIPQIIQEIQGDTLRKIL